MNHQLPGLPIVDGNTLFLDNSRYEVFTTCPRKAEYVVLRQRVSSDTRQALIFGECCHLGLKFRYLFSGNRQMDATKRTQQKMVIDEFYRDKPVPLQDHRTSTYAQTVLESYNDYFQDEDFEFALSPSGRRLIEEGFSFPLGTINGINIVWTGRIDLAVIQQGNLWVMDHKTSSIGGESYFQEYMNSSQMLGYAWALQQHFQQPVAGVIINALFCRKPTKSGKGIEFVRQKIEFDQERIDEWVENTLYVCSDFIHHHERAFFPMHTKQCVGKFGRCEFFDVCSLAPAVREQTLYGTLFKQDVFDPLHPDSINLEEFAQKDVSNWMPKKLPSKDELTDSYLKDLVV